MRLVDYYVAEGGLDEDLQKRAVSEEYHMVHSRRRDCFLSYYEDRSGGRIYAQTFSKQNGKISVLFCFSYSDCAVLLQNCFSLHLCFSGY